MALIRQSEKVFGTMWKTPSMCFLLSSLDITDGLPPIWIYVPTSILNDCPLPQCACMHTCIQSQARTHASKLSLLITSLSSLLMNTSWVKLLSLRSSVNCAIKPHGSQHMTFLQYLSQFSSPSLKPFLPMAFRLCFSPDLPVLSTAFLFSLLASSNLSCSSALELSWAPALTSSYPSMILLRVRVEHHVYALLVSIKVECEQVSPGVRLLVLYLVYTTYQLFRYGQTGWFSPLWNEGIIVPTSNLVIIACPFITPARLPSNASWEIYFPDCFIWKATSIIMILSLCFIFILSP